jgi:hypothetical protein
VTPHRDRFRGVARAARGALLGSAVLLITTAGHAAGHGGTLPDASALLVMLPLFVVLSASLADRRLSTTTLLSYLVGTQVLAHVLLVVGFGHGAHGDGASLTPSPRMLLGHAVATALVLLVLTYGEDLLHRWLRFLADLRRTWNPELAPVLDGANAHWARSPMPLLAWEFASSIQGRGPPTTR